MKVLVLSPHTDDAELGCGGSISRMIEEGKEIFVAVFSTCDESLPSEFEPGTLREECLNSLLSLGVKKENIFFMGYKVRFFKSERQPILEDLVRLKNKINPDLVFLPSLNDYHQDHVTIAEEGVRAFKNNCSILSYELSWNNTGFQNLLYIVLSEKNVEDKYQALSKYNSQNFRSYFTYDFIRSLAKVRGVSNGVNFAESFEVIRFKI